MKRKLLLGLMVILSLIVTQCAEEAEAEYQAETERPNLAVGLLLGVVAAIGATAVWFGVTVLTQCRVGLLAMLVGYAVGRAVVSGAGKKRGTALQVISVVITLTAVAFGDYLTIRHFNVQDAGSEGAGLLLPPGEMLALLIEGVASSPWILIFWIIALLVAFRVPVARRLRRV